jgi:hypothetical protein
MESSSCAFVPVFANVSVPKAIFTGVLSAR